MAGVTKYQERNGRQRSHEEDLAFKQEVRQHSNTAVGLASLCGLRVLACVGCGLVCADNLCMSSGRDFAHIFL